MIDRVDATTFKIGPYEIRRTTGGADGWKVWSGGVALFSSPNLSEACEYARYKTDEYAMTVACPLCLSRAGTQCISEDRQRVLAVPHMARVYARERK